MEDFREHCVQRPWAHWFAEDPDHMAHPYEAGLETFLDARKVTYEVRKPKGPGWAARKHQLEAVERWYLHGWSRLDGRLRSSIVEGVVVFLSLFDDSPAVHRAFCPPRSAYTEDPPAGEPKPLAADRFAARERQGAGAEFSGRDEPWPRAHPRRDAEAGFPARDASAHPADHGQSATHLA